MRLQVQSLALLSGLKDAPLLWLWRRQAATAPIRPLAWEPPYAKGAALEKAKKTKKKKENLHTAAVSDSARVSGNFSGTTDKSVNRKLMIWEGEVKL